MSINPQKPYYQLAAILFLFIQMLCLGVYLVFFLITFLTFDPQPFLERGDTFYQGVSGILILGTISIALLGFLMLFKQYYPERFPALYMPHRKEEIRWYLIFLVSLGIVLLVNLLKIDLHLISFLVSLGSVTYLFHLAQYYGFSYERPSWHHPTTAGGIIEGTAALGVLGALWLFRDPDLHNMLLYILLGILILEILTLWGRFHFLSRESAVTQKTVRTMLGSHLALFGVRFIFGLIMPIVYLGWVLFISSKIAFHPIILMVGVGEISERILFFISADSLSDLKTGENSHQNIQGENHEDPGSTEHHS